MSATSEHASGATPSSRGGVHNARGNEMGGLRISSVAGLLARIAVAAVFVYAAVPKLLDPAAFASDIANYKAFPWWSVNLIAGIVPVLELTAAAAFLVPSTKRGAGMVLVAMDLVFIALISSIMVRGIDIGCGCFGKADPTDPIGMETMLRDLALLGATLFGMFAPTIRSTERPTSDLNEPAR